MRIDGGVFSFEHQKTRNIDHQQRVKKSIQQSTETAGDNETVVAAESSKKKGVIRNLENGHFKGVADVRLRINFQAELAAAAKQKSFEALRQAAPALLEQVTTEFDSFVKQVPLSERQLLVSDELLAKFESNLADALSDVSDPQDAINRLRTDAANLLDSLHKLFKQETKSASTTDEIVLESEAKLTSSNLSKSQPMTKSKRARWMV